MSGLFRKLFPKRVERLNCSAVIVAAGSSERMGADKLKLLLDGIPVLARSLLAFQACKHICEIIIVSRSDDIIAVAELCREYGIDKAAKIIAGGETRTISALIGVSEISERSEFVAIHDGARPLVTLDVIEAAVEAAAKHLAAAPAVPVKDTLKLAEDGMVQSTPERSKLMAVQTPQVFECDLIKAALTDVCRRELEITDDCMAVEELGVRVRLTPGSEENIKITTPLDIKLAEVILRERVSAT